MDRQVILSRDQIELRAAELAYEIVKADVGPRIAMLVVLKGATMFAMDLLKYLPEDTTLHFVRTATYGDESRTAPNEPEITEVDMLLMLRDRNVLIVEDICDSGRTLSLLQEKLLEAKVGKMHTVTLLDKPHARVTYPILDFVGFTLRKDQDGFVFGYGLDKNGECRGLTDICI